MTIFLFLLWLWNEVWQLSDLRAPDFPGLRSEMQGGFGFNESFLSSVADVCLGLTWRTGFFLLEIAAYICVLLPGELPCMPGLGSAQLSGEDLSREMTPLSWNAPEAMSSNCGILGSERVLPVHIQKLVFPWKPAS